ncbi:MAG: cafA [Deltaproteobacteria bacterium]|nr:cafA [Deltaproteobacteria bacterium]
MASELVINVTYSETRIAFLENGTLVEFFIEGKNDRSMVGSIYKGKVVRIVPGMDAAFIDIGLEKSAFLYVGDIVIDGMMYEEFDDSSDFHFEAGERMRVPEDRGRRGEKTPWRSNEGHMSERLRAYRQDGS